MIRDLLPENHPLRAHRDHLNWTIESKVPPYMILDHGIQCAVYACDTWEEALSLVPAFNPTDDLWD